MDGEGRRHQDSADSDRLGSGLCFVLFGGISVVLILSGDILVWARRNSGAMGTHRDRTGHFVDVLNESEPIIILLANAKRST